MAWPTNYDGFSESTPVFGNIAQSSLMRLHNAALNALQTELGLDPSGPFPNVRARLDDIDTGVRTTTARIESASGRDIEDLRGDDVGYAAIGGSLTPGTRVDLRAGTAAAPIAGSANRGPLVKISKTEDLRVADYVSGAANEQSACLVLMNKGAATSEVQTNAAYFVAQNASTQSASNDDAMGLGSTGRIIGSGTGRGIGGYFVGRRDTATGTTNGIEVRSWNQTGTDGTYSPTSASDTMGIWLSSGGTAKNGVAIQVGLVPGNPAWDVGIGFSKIGGASSVATAAISDDSDAVTSLRINGSHTTGIDLSGGTFSGVALKMGDELVEGTERAADPTAPAANGWRLYAKDNGAGKTQLGVLFSSGAFVPFATQP